MAAALEPGASRFCGSARGRDSPEPAIWMAAAACCRRTAAVCTGGGIARSGCSLLSSRDGGVIEVEFASGVGCGSPERSTPRRWRRG